MASESTEQQLGRLAEGQRQHESRMDRMDDRTTRLEGKVDKLIWLAIGGLATLVGILTTTIIGVVN